MKKRIFIALAVVVIVGLCVGAGIYIMQDNKTVDRGIGYSFAGNEEYQQLYHGGMNAQELEELLKKVETEKNAEGIFAVASQIFAKATEDWADTDAGFIAYTWDYAIQNKEADLMEAYVEGLLADGYVQQETDTYRLVGKNEARKWTAQNIVRWDMKRVQLVMDKLDLDTQGAAYGTLNRLGNLETSSIEQQDNWQEIYGADACTIRVYVQEESGDMEIDTLTQKKKTDKSVVVTTCDVRDIINQDVEENLKKWNYNAQEMEELRNHILSDTDVSFAREFFAGEYKNAFDVNPEGMSAGMKKEIAGFMLKLEDLEGDWASDVISPAETELEEIVNTLLYADKASCPNVKTYYHDDYVALIAEAMNERTRNNVTEIFLGQAAGFHEEKMEELELAGMEYHNQYAFWQGIRYLVEPDGGIKDFKKLRSAYAKGNAYITINNLTGGVGRSIDKGGSGGYNFRMEVIASKDAALEKTIFGKNEYIPVSVCNQPSSNEYRKQHQGFWKGREFQKYEQISCEGIDIAPDRAEDVFGYLAELEASEERHQTKEGSLSMFGKYVEIEFLNNSDMNGSNYILREYIGHQTITPHTAYRTCRLEKDGIRAYLEDAYQYKTDMTEEDFKNKILDLRTYIASSDKWMQLFYGKGQEHVFQKGYLNPESGQFESCEESSILLNSYLSQLDGNDTTVGYIDTLMPSDVLSFHQWFNF